jgi:hypothetical protein
MPSLADLLEETAGAALATMLALGATWLAFPLSSGSSFTAIFRANHPMTIPRLKRAIERIRGLFPKLIMGSWSVAKTGQPVRRD